MLIPRVQPVREPVPQVCVLLSRTYPLRHGNRRHPRCGPARLDRFRRHHRDPHDERCGRVVPGKVSPEIARQLPQPLGDKGETVAVTDPV